MVLTGVLDNTSVNQGEFMRSGDKVKVIRESNNLYSGQVIEVVEVVDKYSIEIDIGMGAWFMRKTIPIGDVREIHLN